jgi:ribose transport system permease protein
MTDLHVRPETTQRPTSRLRSLVANPTQESIVLGVALLLLVVFAVSLPAFRTVDNVLLLMRSVAAIGVLGLAMSIVVIARGLDLSLVANMATTIAITLTLLNHHGPVLSIAAGFLIAVGVGVVNGFVISFIEIPALFATLAMGLLEYGVVRALFIKSELVELPDNGHFIKTIGSGRVIGIPISVLVLFALAAVLHFVLSRTVFGRFVYAHGDNPDASALSGISVRTLTITEYAACAGIGFVAGLLLVGSVSGINTSVATGTLIYDVILVVVLGGISLVGGRGGVASVLVGTALVGIMLNGMTLLNLSNTQQDIVRGLILLGALVLDNKLHPRDEETVRQGD